MVLENCVMKFLDGKNMSGPHVHPKILVEGNSKWLYRRVQNQN
jgi:hypothetical protein